MGIYSFPQTEKSFNFEVAKGNVPGHSVVFISGRHPSVSPSSTPTTVWNNTANTYPWSVWTAGAAKVYLNSTNAADTCSILISGLDASYNLQSEVVTLNGLTSVNTVNNYIRMNSAVVVTPTLPVGTVNLRYGSGAGSIIGVIDPNMSGTSMAIYTVPNGYTAFSTYGDFSCNKGNQAELAVKWRFFGGAFVTVYRTEVYESFITSAPSVPGAIPAKTDLDNMVQTVDNPGSRVYSNQQLILVDNNYL